MEQSFKYTVTTEQVLQSACSFLYGNIKERTHMRVKKLLSVREAAALLVPPVSKRRFQQMIDAGKFPNSKKIDSIWLISYKDILAENEKRKENIRVKHLS